MEQNPYVAIEYGGPGTIGCRVHYYAQVTSTQDVARQFAQDGAAHGTAIIADSQTRGHGRLGRQWFSPPGVNLHATVVLRPRMAAKELPLIGLVASIALAEAMETVAPGLGRLKWPDDLWLRGKKAGGIIAQLLSETCVLLGIGVNLNLRREQIPQELHEIATSVLIETGQECDRVNFAAALFTRLNERLGQLQKWGFARMAPLWESYSILTGKRVEVFDGQRRISGTVKGIDNEGLLLLVEGAHEERIITGDVTVEKIDS
jgi:BirA family transcriptional regulator, biotin operon repressor / biotin---[acetyl-CoA-carboxylase] ligase